MTDSIALAKTLINIESVTPHDNGCQAVLSKQLSKAGFSVTKLPFGEVDNLWATHGQGAPFILLQGHTDVVPPGPNSDWATPAFTATEKEGYLFGRGTCDMKASLAAMARAAIDYCEASPDHPGTIAFATTSDEEGPAKNGMKKVVEWIKAEGITVDYCITGEPTSVKTLGDMIKIGRRGSLHGAITFHGKQGHIAYPDDAVNPIHFASGIIDELAHLTLDTGNEHFQPSSLQFHTVKAGTGVSNVIPGKIEATFNIRFNPIHSIDSLKKIITNTINKHNASYDIAWSVSAQPFSSTPGKLTQALSEAITVKTGMTPELSTTGGTSDSRFLATLGCEIVDFGPVNNSAHQVNESILLSDITGCHAIYLQCLKNLCHVE